MKHATHLAFASMAAMFAVSAQAGSYDVFSIDFDGYTIDESPAETQEAAGTWALGEEDDGTVVALKEDSATDKLLQLAASNTSPVTFTPNDESNVIVMDVFFVGAAEEQTPEADSQLGLYLDTTDEDAPVMKISVNGGDFESMTTADGEELAENTWYNVAVKFGYGANATVDVTIKKGETVVATFSGSTASEATKVNAVAFCGSGLVDNFVGKYAFETYTDSSADGTGEALSEAGLTLGTVDGNKTLTSSFATDDLKFIKVTGTDAEGNAITRTLRYVDGQSVNLTGCGIAKITKVVAYYGDAVTATAGAEPETAPVFEDGIVSGSVEVKSGLYYALDVNGVRTALHDNEPVAPEEEGATVDYEVEPDQADYGVVKFKIVVSDDPVAE